MIYAAFFIIEFFFKFHIEERHFISGVERKWTTQEKTEVSIKNIQRHRRHWAQDQRMIIKQSKQHNDERHVAPTPTPNNNRGNTVVREW